MRVGTNPNKEQPLPYSNAYHQVIIPVHIPDQKNYYAKSLEVLKICCSSLMATTHSHTHITIIDNASCIEVREYLRGLVDEKRIHRLITYDQNQGKVDPLVSVMKGCREDLITIADCDVLFKQGWQQEVEKIFIHFPEAGFVSPLPQPGLAYYFSQWSWFYGFTRGCIRRIECPDPESIQIFKQSIGAPDTLNDLERRPFALVRRGCTAIIGAGHFCGTFSKAVIPFLPIESAGRSFLGAEKNALDEPVARGGFLRLATSHGWVYHMGNRPEEWMNKISLEADRNVSIAQRVDVLIKKKLFGVRLVNKVMNKKLIMLLSKYIPNI